MCGAPGSGGPFTIATIVSGTTQPSGIVTDACYLYTLTGTDQVGNAATLSATVTVATPPSGLVTATTQSPASNANTGTNPSAVAISPSGTLMAVANEGSGSVSMFKIDPLTGSLTPVTQSPASNATTGTSPSSVAFHPSGGLIAVTNLADNSVSIFMVDPTTGLLTPVTQSPASNATTGTSPSSVAFSPSGGLIAVTNLGDNSVSMFKVDPTTGLLTPVVQSPASNAATGSDPGSVAFSPSGGLIAVTNYNSGSVSMFTVDPVTGLLTPVTQSPASNATTGTSRLRSRSVRWAGVIAVTNEGSNTVSMFTVDSATGLLTPVVQSPASNAATGTGPGSVAFSPSGGVIAVTNQDDNSVSMFKVDPVTGLLTPVVGSNAATGNGPGAVAFSPSGAYLVTANFDSNSVSVFAVTSAQIGLLPTSVGASVTGNTVYYKGDAPGSLRFTDAVTDAASGPVSAAFPAIATAGWTHAAEAVTVGSGSPPTTTYTSSTFSWTASPSNPTGYTVLSSVAAGNNFTSDLRFVSDTTAPTGGALSVNATPATGAGSSSATLTPSFVVTSRANYSESLSATGSGLTSSILTLQSASLVNDVCGAPGSGGPYTIATIVSGTTQPSGIVAGACYIYKLTGSDQVGNAATVSTTVTVRVPPSGLLTPVVQSPASNANTGFNSPRSVAFSPSGGLIATANSSDSSVSVFKVDSVTGLLTPVVQSPASNATTGTGPRSVAFSPSGGVIAVANEYSDSVSMFKVDSVTGLLTPVVQSPASNATTGTGPSSVAFSPSGGIIAVTNEASNSVSMFKVDSVTGLLTPVVQSPASNATTGTVPSSVAFSPSGGVIAVTNSGSNSVSMFKVDSVTGLLTPVTQSPASNATTGNSPSSVAFSPSGGVIAVTNQFSGSVSMFKVDSVTGLLTPVVQSPASNATTGSSSNPSSVAFSPSGGVISVANLGSSSVSMFKVDTVTGLLTPAPSTPASYATTGFSPVSVAFSPSGGHIAVTNEGSSSVSVFAVTSAQIGLLPASGGSSIAGNTVYYKGDAPGSFGLTAAVTDAASGPVSAGFPAIATAGWTHAAETVTGGTGSPPTTTYTSSTFSWTANPSNPTGYSVLSSVTAGNNFSSDLRFVNDTTAPTGGALSVNATPATGAGSSSSASTPSFVITSRANYSESKSATGSGLTSGILTLQSASLVNGVCGAPGSGGPFTIATIVSGTTQPSGIVADACYVYTLTGRDQVGNAATLSTTVTVESPPVNTAAPSITGTAAQASTLTASTGTWSGNPSSFAYQWQACSSAACADIAGAASSTFVPTITQRDSKLQVVVTATNATGTTVATSATTQLVTPGTSPLTIPTNGAVNALAQMPDGSTIIGGAFTAVGGTLTNAPAISTANAQSFTSVVLNTGGTISAIAPDAAGYYIGGVFTSVNGQSRFNLAQVDASGNVTSFNPGANSNVSALVLSGSTLYAGGSFNTLGGGGSGVTSRSRIGAVDTSSGAATSFNPGANITVNALVLSGSTLYAGGSFNTLGGGGTGVTSRSLIGAVDISTGAATSFNPGANAAVNELVLSGSTLYAGGAFTTLGGGGTGVTSRSRIGAVNTSSGAATSFNPGASATVSALVLSGSTLYAGGGFMTLGGGGSGVALRSTIGAVNTSSGAATKS